MTMVSFTRDDIEQSIPERFARVVAECADQVALLGERRQWTFRELDEASNQIAQAIAERTAEGQGCVAYVAALSPEMVILALGILKAGKATCGIHPQTPPDVVQRLVAEVGAELLVAGRGFEHFFAAANVAPACVQASECAGYPSTPVARPAAAPGDTALLLLTSGTTGRAKAVMRSHRAMLHRVWLSTQHDRFTGDDRQSMLTHLAFAAAYNDFTALLQGVPVAVFDVATEGLPRLAAWVSEARITALRPPILLFRRLMASLAPGHQFPHVRLVVLGGDSVSVSDVEAWKAHFVGGSELVNRFSATETTLLTEARFSHDSTVTPETVAAGWPVADKALQTLDADGAPVAHGEVGRLCVRSRYLADGYWNQPEETARRFGVDADDPRVRTFRTGDLGRLLPDGRWLYVGRADHQVKIRNYRVEIAEVEFALRRCQGVLEGAVVALKTEHDEQLVGAVVTEAFDERQLKAELGRALAEWKVPNRVFRVDALPSTAGGKIDRQRLVDDLRSRLASERAPIDHPPRGGMSSEETRVAQCWQSVLGRAVDDRDEDFFAAGGDSLRAADLHLLLERVSGRQLALNDLFATPTVAAMSRYVATSPPATGRAPLVIGLRLRGQRSPLFLVHGRIGQAFVSPSLLRALGDDQPVYAFQASGLDWDTLPALTIDAMAERYVAELQGIRPDGPYLIGGLCAGGVLAVAIANRLVRQGARVAPLLLLDPSNPADEFGRLGRWRRLLTFAVQRRFTGAPLTARMRRSLERRARQGRVLPSATAGALAASTDAAFRFRMALLRATSWRFDGPAIVLRSRERLERDGPSRQGPFSRHLQGDVRWCEVGDRHRDVFDEGNRVFASRLRDAVDYAHAALAGR